MEDILSFRPMTTDDVDAAYELVSHAFARDREEILRRTPGEVAHRKDRYRHFLSTDPAGAWLAEDGEGRLAGVSIALRRGEIWILSLLAVDESYRGQGVGKKLLQRAMGYAEGCRGGMIASSTHPAAMRSYALAGFTLCPTLTARGYVDRRSLPGRLGVREGGGENDLRLAAEVDRFVRGAPHGPDLEFLLDSGARMFVYEAEGERGYALTYKGRPLVLAARGEKASTALLWEVLANSDPQREVEISWITAEQQWAVRVALAAGLVLEPAGPICIRGELGPLAPYLPNGAFL
ncbi:GNAT family N-acetyltransferase [Rubrobacter calidifluminis]|uniref:GNAT family N-acetyltransferase n=1 Tax=Rubrobacter calidifluminis TaxID=1392640 RepID=UPI002360F816|nr:GNAT family N-acetyltransferase [Rubrobacter calidifluminis]